MKKLIKICLALIGAIVVISFPGISNAEDPNVVVPANPLWTDTRTSLNIGDIVAITASGSWCWGGPGWFGPDGDSGNTFGLEDTFYWGAAKGALIAFIGPDPYQGRWGDANFFPQTSGYWNIGSSATFTSDKTGELWLGFNDAARSMGHGVADNRGLVTALISVIPVPVTVTIDIKASNVPVAILSSTTFDAVTVDRSTVEFAGAHPLPNYCSQLGEIPEDVDGDGLLDIVFYFKTQDLNLQPDDTEACLTGKTFSGQGFRGCESICRLGPVVGDLDNDCKVDFKDFAIFASRWLKCTDPNCG